MAFHTYFPFGEEATASEDGERLKFTGHERDFNSEGSTDDLDYMLGRFYAPVFGRFLSTDPVDSSDRESGGIMCCQLGGAPGFCPV